LAQIFLKKPAINLRNDVSVFEHGSLEIILWAKTLFYKWGAAEFFQRRFIILYGTAKFKYPTRSASYSLELLSSKVVEELCQNSVCQQSLKGKIQKCTKFWILLGKYAATVAENGQKPVSYSVFYDLA